MPQKKKSTSATKKATKRTTKKNSSKASSTSKRVKKTTAVKAAATKTSNTIVKKKRKNIKIKVLLSPLTKKILFFVIPLIVVFFLVDSFVQYLNNDYSIAIVNGKRITKSAYYNELNKAYGQQVLEALIQDELIKQEAEKKGITASNDEIEKRYKEIEKQAGGPEQLKNLLKQYNMTEDDLRNRIVIQILQEKLAEPSVKYTDEDLKKFFEQYKDALYPNQKDVKFEDKKAEIEKYYKQNKLNEAEQQLLQNLEKEALIQNNLKDKPKFKIFGSLINILHNLSNKVQKK